MYTHSERVTPPLSDRSKRAKTDIFNNLAPAHKLITVEVFLPELPVEAHGERVLPRSPRLDVDLIAVPMYRAPSPLVSNAAPEWATINGYIRPLALAEHF